MMGGTRNILWQSLTIASAFLHFRFRQPFIMGKLSKRKLNVDLFIRGLPIGDQWHSLSWDSPTFLKLLSTSRWDCVAIGGL